MSKSSFELEYPYSERWRKGYLVINPENRRTVILYNSHKDRSSTSYSRYLMSVKLGRFLEDDEHVDHIDNDKTNDSIENLQILTLAENNIKSNRKPLVNLTCPVCKINFSKTRTELRGRLHRIESNSICCSRRCSGKYRQMKYYKK